MAYPVELKEKALALRKNGYSIKEIAKVLNIGVGTSSVWLTNISLDQNAQDRLKSRSLLGSYHTILTFKRKRENLVSKLNKKSLITIQSKSLDRDLSKIYCALLYWAEGSKTDTYVGFTNSDIRMVGLFLRLLRKGFEVDEKKLHATLHLHEYHNEQQIKNLWAEGIDIQDWQFNKIYLKPHTKKRRKDYYPGCINIRYYDYKIALELHSIYNMLARLA